MLNGSLTHSYTVVARLKIKRGCPSFRKKGGGEEEARIIKGTVVPAWYNLYRTTFYYDFSPNQIHTKRLRVHFTTEWQTTTGIFIVLLSLVNTIININDQ